MKPINVYTVYMYLYYTDAQKNKYPVGVSEESTRSDFLSKTVQWVNWNKCEKLTFLPKSYFVDCVYIMQTKENTRMSNIIIARKRQVTTITIQHVALKEMDKM